MLGVPLARDAMKANKIGMTSHLKEANLRQNLYQSFKSVVRTIFGRRTLDVCIRSPSLRNIVLIATSTASVDGCRKSLPRNTAALGLFFTTTASGVSASSEIHQDFGR
jgi:hypothetical protein